MKIKDKINNNIRITIDDFMDFPSISIDYALMEKSDKIAVIPTDIGWNDIGSFYSLYEMLEKDRNHSVIQTKKNYLGIESKNLLVMGQKRLIATAHVKDLVIVDTEDALLISDLYHTQEVKKIFTHLNDQNSSRAEVHKKRYFPWGYEEVLHEEKNFHIKKLHLPGGLFIPEVQNQNESKTWTILEGTAEIVKDGEKKLLSKSRSLFIPANCPHSIKNNNIQSELVVLESIYNGTD